MWFPKENQFLLICFFVSGCLLLFLSVSPWFFLDDVSQWFRSFPVKMMSFACHQNFERTIFIQNVPAAVCARCLGIYFGVFTGFLLAFIMKSGTFKSRNLLKLLVITALIIFFDAIIQWAGIWTGNNVQRLLTGLFFGISLSVYLSKILILKP